MDCDGVRKSIFLFIDREMAAEDTHHMERHLARCPDCARRRDYTQRWLLLVRRRMVRLSAPPTLRHRILELLS
jgi:anti-sigma factor (TIGR02949 family)